MVPDFERITIDWVLAPLPQYPHALDEIAVADCRWR